MAYRLNFISPYVGIKWARAKIDFDGAYVAQPQLSEEKLDLVTWNPTLRGATQTGGDHQADFLTKVSVTLNKLKSKGSASLFLIEKLLTYGPFCKKSLPLKPALSLYARASSATTSSIDSLKLTSPLLSLCLNKQQKALWLTHIL
ncbi:hypothetical protein [Chlamydiifrater phoenicopteri]|uniref:hypothetical protein n=1 Tax=Chlamydiifrater phoenicopteri TaxID=2681469 RepID=UPI003CCE7020